MHTLEAYGIVEVQLHSPWTLTFCWRWEVSFIPQLFHPQQPLNKMLNRPQNWSGCSGEEKWLLPLPQIKPRLFNCPACSLCYQAVWDGDWIEIIWSSPFLFDYSWLVLRVVDNSRHWYLKVLKWIKTIQYIIPLYSFNFSTILYVSII